MTVTPPTPSLQPPGIFANPWFGTDHLAWLRQQIDGYRELRMPDGPPLSPGDAASLFMQFADGVEEGYSATYSQLTGPDIAVHAIRFGITPLPTTNYPFGVPPDHVALIEIGRLRVVVRGDGQKCSMAIEQYVRSLTN